MLAAIFGCGGVRLTDEERAFFKKTQPWGFIVFARNIESPDQLRALTADLRACVDHDDLPILIDQEGGRVARMRPPHWRAYPNGEAFAKLAETSIEGAQEAARLTMQLIGQELMDVGVNVDCLPILDVRQPFSHDVIGDRAYGTDPATVTAIGNAVSDGLASQGVLPIIKHIPGHGRARVDSHLELPVAPDDLNVLEEVDFAPFKALAHLPMAMTAHLVYPAIDPDRPATTSKRIISDVIRKQIGFSGLLMTDDLSMEALGGSIEDRAAESIQAGCDMVLHCNGKMGEMEAVAKATPQLAGDALKRAEAVAGFLSNHAREELDPDKAIKRLTELGVEVENV